MRSPRGFRFWSPGLVALGFGLCWSPPAGALQPEPPAISGRVTERDGASPVAGVRVNLMRPRRSVLTDGFGRFLFDELSPGLYRLEVLVSGRAPLGALLRVDPGAVMEVEFRLNGEGGLEPTVYIDGESVPDLIREITTFERRMASGPGRFVTSDDIEQRNPLRLIDMLRTLPGVRALCGGGGCRVRLNHDPRDCGPAIFLDAVQTGTSVLESTSPRDVEGVEIYRGPSETPPELNNDTARCGGAIVIWTRRGLAP